MTTIRQGNTSMDKLRNCKHEMKSRQKWLSMLRKKQRHIPAQN